MSTLPWRLTGRALLHSRCSMACYATAANPVAKPESSREKAESYLRETERMSRVAPRTRTKKPQREPFAKGLFVGRFDTDMLAYPELEKEDVERLAQTVGALPTEKAGGPRLLVETLAGHGLVGLQAPGAAGGRDMNVTESCRVLEGVAGHPAVANAIASEWLGVQALLRFGSEPQKARYLSKLMSGEVVAAFCLLEDKIAGGPESVGTVAKLEPGTDSWVLNGEKIWVLNGNCADLFVVLAETSRILDKGMDHVQVTAFIVDRTQEGVSISKYPLDVDSPDMAYVKLTNVRAPSDQVLGSVDNGKSVIQALMPEFRLACGVPPVALTRTMLNELTRFCIDSSCETLPLYETEEVLTLSGRLAMWLYAMESLVYFTTGLMDQYEGQDCELEAAIVKAFNAEHARMAAEACVHFIGTSTLLKDHWCSTALKQSLKYVALQESQDNMKMMIALMGLQHAGVHLKDTITKLRNPLFNAGFIFRRMWDQRRNHRDEPRLDLGLESYLHPTLRSAASRLEYVVARLQFAVELSLSRFGGTVVNKHTDLGALGECAAIALAMTACLGRASRAYCIGLRNASHDLLLADAFCNRGADRVKRTMARIAAGDVLSTDKSLREAAEQSFKTGRYFAEHPLTRNF